MNVLYHFRTQGRGAEGVHIAGVANAFESMGHQLVFSNPSGRDPRKPVENDASTGSARAGLLRRFASRAPGVAFEAAEIGYNAASLAANARKIRTHGIDFIYERHAFFLCSTAGLAKAFDIPLVVEVNELVGDDRVRAQPALAPLARLADRVTFSRADVIVVVSPHLKRRMIEMGVEGDKILVQPNGVPASEVAAAETGGTRGAAVRARYGLEGEIVIGFVGLFLDWHRLDWMVEAFASLRPAERGITLMMVGDGPSESFAEVGRRLGVDAKILRTGRVDRAAIPEHLAAMDIGVIPHSNAFRSPIKLFEYMAQSLAVAASATEPIEMVIEDGCNGVLFDTSGPESMGAAFERLVGDPERRRALGARARQDVIERYTWEHNAEEVIATLRRRGRLRDPTDA